MVSKHVGDIRLIFNVVALLVVAGLVILFTCGSDPDSGDAKFLASGIALGGVILAWCYQSASKRLGVVNLFACEISTLCKVGTVIGTIGRLTTAFDNKVPPSGKALPEHYCEA
jgi:hypothetical protein